MSDDLIRNQVQAQQPSSGVNVGFNVQGLKQQEQAIGGAIQSAGRFISQEEKFRRVEDAEMTDADTVNGRVKIQESALRTRVAISEAKNEKEVDQIIESEETMILKDLSDPEVMRTKRGRNDILKYFKLHKTAIYKQPGELRKASLRKQNSNAKYMGAIESQLMDVNASNKSTEAIINHNLKGLGLQPDEVKRQQVKYMHQFNINKAKHSQALYRTDVDTVNRYAEDRIKGLKAQKEFAKNPQGKKELALEVNNALVRAKEESEILADTYRKNITESELSVIEKEVFTQEVDTNLNAQQSYLKGLSKQIDQEQAAFVTKNENNIRLWGQKEENLNKIWPLNDWIDPKTGQHYQGAKQMHDSGNMTDSFYESLIRRTKGDKITKRDIRVSKEKYSQVFRALPGITPSTDPLEIKKFDDIISQIPDRETQRKAEKMLLSRTQEFDKQFEEDWKIQSAPLDAWIKAKGLDPLSPGWGQDAGEVIQEQFSLDESIEAIRTRAEEIFRDPKGGREAAEKYMFDNVKEILDEDMDAEALKAFVPSRQITFDTIRERLKKTAQIPKVTEELKHDKLTGDLWFYDTETKKSRLIERGQKGLRAEDAAKAKAKRIADEKVKAEKKAIKKAKETEDALLEDL